MFAVSDATTQLPVCRYADDWITQVYSGFKKPPLMVKRTDVTVVHTLAPQRYATALPANVSALLQHEVAKGKAAVRMYALEYYNADLQN